MDLSFCRDKELISFAAFISSFLNLLQLDNISFIRLLESFLFSKTTELPLSDFWHGRSPVNLLHIFRTPFPKNTSGELLLGNSNKISNSEESLSLKGSFPINKILKHTSN